MLQKVAISLVGLTPGEKIVVEDVLGEVYDSKVIDASVLLDWSDMVFNNVPVPAFRWGALFLGATMADETSLSNIRHINPADVGSAGINTMNFSAVKEKLSSPRFEELLEMWKIVVRMWDGAMFFSFLAYNLWVAEASTWLEPLKEPVTVENLDPARVLDRYRQFRWKYVGDSKIKRWQDQPVSDLAREVLESTLAYIYSPTNEKQMSDVPEVEKEARKRKEVKNASSN